MRTALVGIFLALTLSATAQHKCVNTTYEDLQSSLDPAFRLRQRQVESFIQQRAQTFKSAADNGSPVIRIPVVVHVLYKNSTTNIPDARIISQLAALNRDFRRRNTDTVNTPARFRFFAADVEIEFVLATVTPTGRATTGIVRKQTSINNWGLDDAIKFSSRGGDDAWDSRSYFNIWIGSMIGVLGYSSTPGSAVEKDGVVLNTDAVATVDQSGAYGLGRTLVHETGHWLGLKHIWGDTYCGDDGVADTPKQGNFTTGCPSTFRSSCDNGALGDMYMNYMDFTDDPCMNLFTKGQKQRMLSLFASGGPRASLLTGKGFMEPWATEAPVDTTVTIASVKTFPNPVTNTVRVTLDNAAWIGKWLIVADMNGSVMRKTRITSLQQNIDVQSLKPGIYFLRGLSDEMRLETRIIKL